MQDVLQDIASVGLRKWVEDRSGLLLPESTTELRSLQEEALDWALSRSEPYLFINAPTGSGKTLLNGLYGIVHGGWTYAVHTKALQAQVAETFGGVSMLTGRSNHPCLLAQEGPLGRKDIMADQGVCRFQDPCDYQPKRQELEWPDPVCPYYDQLYKAQAATARVTNYSMVLGLTAALRPLLAPVMVADEAHRIEEIVAGHVSFKLNHRTFGKYSIDVPQLQSPGEYGEWARNTHLPDPRRQRDFGLLTAHKNLRLLQQFTDDDDGKWLIDSDRYGVEFAPVWGDDFVMSSLFGHGVVPDAVETSDLLEMRGAHMMKVLMTSATLMGPEYIAERLGLPDGSWAYLDLPSTFPARQRPINYAPVVRMGRRGGKPAEAKMLEAIDGLIQYYLTAGSTSGLIHAVSNRYRDDLLHSSRWSAIMTTEAEEHATRVAAGKPSVLVAANKTEGWDGVDDLCRFVIFPKVPFQSLGDRRTKVRMQEDPRSYDWSALVAVVQGSGRGVRHRGDYADTWILDEAWRMLYGKRKGWLPQSFLDAYHHNVKLPF